MGVHVFHPEPPSHLPPIPLGHPSALALSTLSGQAIYFTYGNIHVSMLFSQIIPPWPSPTESKRLFYTSVSLLLSHIQGYHYHLSKFTSFLLKEEFQTWAVLNRSSNSQCQQGSRPLHRPAPPSSTRGFLSRDPWWP